MAFCGSKFHLNNVTSSGLQLTRANTQRVASQVSKVGQHNNDERFASNDEHQLLGTAAHQKSTMLPNGVNNVGHIGSSRPSTRNSAVGQGDQREGGSSDWPCTSLPTYVLERHNLAARLRSEQPDRSTSQTVPLPIANNHPSDRSSRISQDTKEEGLRCPELRIGGPGLNYHPLAPHWQQASAPTISCSLGGHPDLSSTIPNTTDRLESATYSSPTEPSSPRRQHRLSVNIETARIASIASTSTQLSSSSANGPSVNGSPSNEKVGEACDREWLGFRSQCIEMLRTMLSTALCFMSPLFLLGAMDGAWGWV